jgi:SAM-dependent methyltransferase
MKKNRRRPRPWWLLVPALGGLVAAPLLWRRGAGTRVEGARWYGFVYRTAYLLGLKVWDRDVPLADLVQLVEGASASGRALDLGCGTGTDSIYLAQHDWVVTGVDMVPQGSRHRAPQGGCGGCLAALPAGRRDAAARLWSGRRIHAAA